MNNKQLAAVTVWDVSFFTVAVCWIRRKLRMP